MMKRHKTPKIEAAEQHVRDAIKHLVEARCELTLWEFMEFLKENERELGYRGFIRSVGQAMNKAFDTADAREAETPKGENDDA